MSDPRGFASDNFSGAHPEVLEAIASANEGHAEAYGGDAWTERVAALFRRHFGDGARAFLVFNGTAANVLCLRAAARPGAAAICPETAHMNVDECGAPERLAGVKLLTVPTEDGKLTPQTVGGRIARIGDQHAAQPRLVSISQATELGTVYTEDEIRALADLCHAHEMVLHVDGARLANAAAGLGVPLRALTADADVDLLSFGGTKNGLVCGDAAVILRPELAEGFEYLRKQTGQLASKMRFLASQFEALLGECDLWLRNAERANSMATRLRTGVEGIEGVEITQPTESNAVFARLSGAVNDRLRSELPGEIPFYVWNESTGEVRWMTSWDTTESDVDRFVATARDAALQ